MLAPICLFTYNRIYETQQTVKALQDNFLAPASDLFVFSDGAKFGAEEKVKEVRDFIKNIGGFKSVTVFESPKNVGLADSIINGVTKVISKNGKVIVLEDDLITSPNFLNFMNQSLKFYKDDKLKQSINGYSLPVGNDGSDVYFQVRPFSWGWATWKDRWDEEIFDKEKLKYEIEVHPKFLKEFGEVCGDDIPKMFKDSIYGRNNSWYVRWAYAHYRNNTFSVYPSISLVENVGFNSDGTHCTGIGAYNYPMLPSDKKNFNFSVSYASEPSITKKFLHHFTLLHKIKIRIQHLKSSYGRKLLWREIKQRLT